MKWRADMLMHYLMHYRRLGLSGLAAAGLLSAALITWAGGAETVARAQGAGPTARPKAQACVQRPGMLGVARVVEIDTAGGPRFGSVQYTDHEFLRDREVVLTFDDGPQTRNTRLVLEALAQHCTQATFFMVGQMALAYPDLVREVSQAGHTVGTHTWSHRNLRAAGAANAQHEIELGVSAVQRSLGGSISPFFRFPYLADSPSTLAYAGTRNLAVFSIDADSKDFRTQDPRTMHRTIMGALSAKGKGILLFHDIQNSTAQGIRMVLDDLAAKGYRVVHMVPKDAAATVARFDTLAEGEFNRRNKLAAANPMAQRSVVAPLTPPGATVEQSRPENAASAGIASQRGGAKARLGVTATPQPQPTPTAAPIQQPIPAAAADKPPVMRGTTEDDDWRRRVFQH